ITAASDLSRGGYDLWVVATNGESGRITLQVDDLPQIRATRPDGHPQPLEMLPASVWAMHQKSGDAEEFSFHADASQTLIFDVAAKSFGSKSEIVLTLADNNGKVLASNNGFDQRTDPFIAYTFAV